MIKYSGLNVRERLIWSPVPYGSGAIEIHKSLARSIPGYGLCPYNPKFEFFPPLLRRFRNAQARLVHAPADHAVLLTAPRQPLVVTFHNFVLDDEMRHYANPVQFFHYRTDLRWFTERALKRAQVVTAVSRFTANAVEAFFGLKRPVKVIENGVDTDTLSPAPFEHRSIIRVLVSGNASRRKGTHLISEIAARLNPGIEIACTLDESELRRWTGNVPNVLAIGRQRHEQMPDVYRHADILLMPTAREGFGLAVAEAMACGLPVVASDCSTMPDLVAHQEGGYLCPLDAPLQFAERINELARSPQTRARMGEFNRQRVLHQFSLGNMTRAYRSLFDEVLSE